MEFEYEEYEELERFDDLPDIIEEVISEEYVRPRYKLKDAARYLLKYFEPVEDKKVHVVHFREWDKKEVSVEVKEFPAYRLAFVWVPAGTDVSEYDRDYKIAMTPRYIVVAYPVGFDPLVQKPIIRVLLFRGVPEPDREVVLRILTEGVPTLYYEIRAVVYDPVLVDPNLLFEKIKEKFEEKGDVTGKITSTRKGEVVIYVTIRIPLIPERPTKEEKKD